MVTSKNRLLVTASEITSLGQLSDFTSGLGIPKTLQSKSRWLQGSRLVTQDPEEQEYITLGQMN